MAKQKDIGAQLDVLEATATAMLQQCYQIRTSLGVVSTPPTARKGKLNPTVAKLLARRERNISKRQQKSLQR